MIEKHTDTLIEKTKTKPQETLEFKMNKQMQTILSNPPINLVQEGEWFSGVSSFEATNFAFNITTENNSFSITLPGHWNSKSAEKTVDELNKILELTSKKDIDLQVEQVTKKTINFNKRLFYILGMLKEEILEELKNAKYKDLEDMVNRFQLRYNEYKDKLHLK